VCLNTTGWRLFLYHFIFIIVACGRRSSMYVNLSRARFLIGWYIAGAASGVHAPHYVLMRPDVTLMRVVYAKAHFMFQAGNIFIHENKNTSSTSYFCIITSPQNNLKILNEY
jgi:hypothetical protein